MSTPTLNSMLPAQEAADLRPWPVVLLTALGAWLSALPLVLMANILLGDVATRGAGPYACGLLVLVAGVVVCRSRQVPLFVEQLAVPALLVGGGLLSLGLYRDLGDGGASLLVGGVALLVAGLVPQAWLRAVLGATAAGFVLAGVMVVSHVSGSSSWPGWVGLHLLLLVWLLAWAAAGLLPNAAWARLSAGQVQALEAIGAGWLFATLAGLALWSGMTFLVGGALGVHDAGFGGSALPAAMAAVMQAASVGLMLVATVLLAARWPLVQQPPVVAALLVLAALAWWLPTLGAVGLALVLTATGQRWRLATAAGLASAWIIGSFYYQLQWPLTVKALWLLGSGAMLAALAWWAHFIRMQDEASPAASTVGAVGTQQLGDAPLIRAASSAKAYPAAAPLVLATLLATLALVNAGIWQKERLISQGQPVFVELAPVDPRSLMQGDYMRLAFRLPDGVPKLDPALTVRPQVVLRRDGEGVSQAVRVHTPSQALAANEVSVTLAPVAGQWVLVTDAWYFKEGDAERWAAARYGEFRVLPDGQALLVGLADAQRRPIR